MKIYFPVLFSFLSSCASVPSDAEFPAVDIDESYLKQVVEELAVNIGPRNLDHYESLRSSSEYIQGELKKSGFDVELQRYSVLGKKVENIIASVGPKDADRVVVGAHYDTFGNQPGADDNASGVAGLIALAKLLKDHEHRLTKRVDIVAFTLEEPPFFRSKNMGSYVHAKSLSDNKVSVIAMIAVEMIGFFSEKEESQDYPLSILHLFYPDEGNFVGVVSNISSRGLKSVFRDLMSKSDIEIQSLSAPTWLAGIDFSDHLNYWEFGYDAIMVTDTAFYRNKNYHQATDTIETLNFSKMADVVQGIFYGVLNLASR